MKGDPELLKYRSVPDRKGHPYPVKIALRTQEFILGTIFYYILFDESSGLFFKTPDSIETLKKSFLEKGLDITDWDSNWDILNKYQKSIKPIVFQNVLVALKSNWDWYLNHLTKFISFVETQNKRLDKSPSKLTNIIGRDIIEQIHSIEKICQVDLRISEDSMQQFREMTLIRNIGLHNRWEVDQRYLDRTNTNCSLHVGEIRIISPQELQLWQKALIELIHNSCIALSIKYATAPDFA